MMRLLLVTLLASLVAASAMAAEPIREAPITDDDRAHWAFQPVVKPAVPTVVDSDGWMNTPIDAFILERLARKKLHPQSEANKAKLMRRVTFDLTGLPPTPYELAAFENDRSPQAYERVVDRLLASPQHGERWAQFWLDLARFAETDGFEHDRARPEAWKYRDWVIRAINRDVPYDEFLSLQLAGDELRPGDSDASTATLFCLAGPDMPDVNAQDVRRHDLLNELTATVGAVTMGLQLGCAQCHDHKYDPLSQADFYRLRAFFEPAVKVQRDKPVGPLSEKSATAPPSFFYVRGDFTRPGEEVQPQFVRVVNRDNAVVPAPGAEAKSSGRRAALARWLTSPEHPLTARVMANRLWQHHFGRGLCTTPSDFGLVGDEATHPELLDWLASELVEHEWSLKHVQRLIVISRVYRQAGRPATADDEAGELYGYFPRQRLSGEALRDAMLAASGQLNQETGGPGVMPPLAKEVAATLLGDQWKVTADPAQHVRRSIYVFARRNLRYPLFETFDRADPNQTCAARHVSTTASQALVMLNSRFSLDAARHLAARALREADGDIPRATQRAFLLALARPPSDKDAALAQAFFADQVRLLNSEARPADALASTQPPTDKLSPVEAAAFVDLCLALFNSSEFVYVD